MTLPKIAGVFLVMSLLANVTAFAIGTSRGLLPPQAFDFGDSEHLLRLSAEFGSHQLPLTLSLLSPVLALPVGYAFFHVLKAAGWPAAFGAAMFFAGMIFVVLLDVLELVAIGRLAPAYGAAPDFARPAIAAVGDTVDLAIDVLSFVGHFFSFGRRSWRSVLRSSRSRIFPIGLADYRSVPAFMLGWMVPLLALLGQDAGPVVGIGIAVVLHLAGGDVGGAVAMARSGGTVRTAALFLLLVAMPWASDAQTIEGRWKLLAAEDLRADGTVARYPWGRNPIGSIVVDRGWCYVQIMSSDVPAFTAAPAIGEQMSAMLLKLVHRVFRGVHGRRQGRQRHAQGRRRVAAELCRHGTETVLPHREEPDVLRSRGRIRCALKVATSRAA